MNNKAQVTIFVVIGILIIAVILFLLFIRGSFTSIGREANLDEELLAVNAHVQSCLHDISGQESLFIAKQGGYFAALEGSYRYYNDTKISYLCYDIEGQENCRNRLLLKKDMEANLEKNIESLLTACINLNEFSSNQLSILPERQWNVDVVIGDESTIISLDYPIRITSKVTKEELRNSQYSIKLNYPLGRLYNVATKIISDEALTGNFDPLPYMLLNPDIKIIKLRPYPDKIYIIKKVDSPYTFQFAIQG